MRLLGYILITAGLILGTLGAATAYNASTDLPDERLLGAELGAPAAYRPSPGAPAVEVGKAGDRITPGMLRELRAQNVPFVRLSEFSPDRWERKWWVVLACAALVAGAVLVRRGARAKLAAAGARRERESASLAIDRIEKRLEELRSDLEGASDEREATRRIVAGVGEIQRHELATFVDAREELRGRLGLGRFAELMDRFASLERALNRAWSAAADGHLGESAAALERAAGILPLVRGKLPGSP